MMKVVPLFKVLSTIILPQRASIMCLQIASPEPRSLAFVVKIMIHFYEG
jgi:hypothetical protein